MKTILTTLITIVLTSTLCLAQRTFTFNIDQKDYQIDEKTLNDLFGAAFNSLVQKGVADNSHFDIWASSYSDWKDHIIGGTFNWETYGDRVAKSSFTGHIPIEYLGWDAPGKQSTGNPNKKRNIARRMACIRDSLSNQLIYYFIKKIIVN